MAHPIGTIWAAYAVFSGEATGITATLYVNGVLDAVTPTLGTAFALAGQTVQPVSVPTTGRAHGDLMELRVSGTVAAETEEHREFLPLARWALPDDEMQLEATTVTTIRSGLSTLTAQQVWEYGARSLTTFGALVSDTASAVWAAVTRTLTAGTKDEAIDSIKEKTDNLPESPASKGDAMTLTSEERSSVRDGLAQEATVASLGDSISGVPAAVWAFATASMTVVGSVGKWLVDKLGLAGQFDFSGSGGTLRAESTNMRGTDGAAIPGDEMKLVLSEKTEIRDGLALGSAIDALNNISSQDVESALTAFGTAKATDVSESETEVLQGVTAAREAVIVEVNKTNARITEDRAVKLDNLDKKSSDIYDKLLEVENITGEIQISGMLDVDGFTAGGTLTFGELLTKLNAFVSGKVEVVGLSPLRFRVYDDDADPNTTGSGTALFDLEQHSGGRTPR